MRSSGSDQASSVGSKWTGAFMGGNSCSWGELTRIIYRPVGCWRGCGSVIRAIALCDSRSYIAHTGQGTRSMPNASRQRGSEPRAMRLAGSVLQEARQAGLLDDRTDHVSFRAPRALIEAA